MTCEGSVWLSVNNKEGIGLVGMKRDETFLAEKDPPPRPAFPHIRDDEPKATAIGLFRHEDADFRCTMTRIRALRHGLVQAARVGLQF